MLKRLFTNGKQNGMKKHARVKHTFILKKKVGSQMSSIILRKARIQPEENNWPSPQSTLKPLMGNKQRWRPLVLSELLPLLNHEIITVWAMQRKCLRWAP